MKKIILVAIMAIMGLQSQAQIVSSRSAMIQQGEKWGWNTFSFEYLALNMTAKELKVSDVQYGDYYAGTASGFGFTYMRAISLTRNHRVPLYLEPGIGMEFYVGGKTTQNIKMLTAKVPLNFIYDISLANDQIHIDPYIGLRFRGNIYGEDDGYNWKSGYRKDSRDVFNETKMGGDGWAFTRFQVGWQIGCKFRFSKFYLQLGWGTDFNNLVKNNKTRTSQFQSAIGVAF